MRVSKIENLQTANKSRGWFEFWRFSDQTDRNDASCFMKIFRTNETSEKFPENSKTISKNNPKNLKIDIADVIDY